MVFTLADCVNPTGVVERIRALVVRDGAKCSYPDAVDDEHYFFIYLENGVKISVTVMEEAEE